MRLFGVGRRRAQRAPAALPPDIRVYAIGDVHGRLDLLKELLARIQADDRARQAAQTHLVMLGDLIDRGPDSRAIVEMFLRTPPAFADTHLLMGNHEEMLLKLLDEPTAEALAHFLRYGGYETLQSYGASEQALEMADLRPPEVLTRLVPEEHRAFIRSFGDSWRMGDYLFVHAGIRPDIAIDQQAPGDMRWIRRPFLESESDHGVTVVHGHTISVAPERRANRIGIDTGAYATGVLTALGLEDDDQWIIATDPASDDNI